MDSYHCVRNRTRRNSDFIRVNGTILLISIVSYLCNNQILKHLSDNSLIHGQLNDLLGILLFLSYVHLLTTFFAPPSWRLYSGKRVIFLTLFAALWWEYITPYYHTTMTDTLDIAAYCIGASLYAIIIITTKNKTQPKPLFREKPPF